MLHLGTKLMASSSSFSLPFLLVLISVPMTMGDIICSPVFGALVPCISCFLNPVCEKPSDRCCAGAAILAAAARLNPGKPVVCQCLKKMMEENPLISPEKAHNVTAQCNAVLPFPGSDTNCSTTKY